MTSPMQKPCGHVCDCDHDATKGSTEILFLEPTEHRLPCPLCRRVCEGRSHTETVAALLAEAGIIPLDFGAKRFA